MSRNHYIPTFFVAVTAGLVGGAISRAVLEPTTVFAQRRLQPEFTPKTLRAHAFEIVDAAGHTRGIFAVGSDNVPAIRLYDANGGIYWSTGKTGMLPAADRP
ncbi:MAG: hypothetical protein ACRD9L_12675 [Bryobacteraceae bacterium]